MNRGPAVLEAVHEAADVDVGGLREQRAYALPVDARVKRDESGDGSRLHQNPPAFLDSEPSSVSGGMPSRSRSRLTSVGFGEVPPASGR